MSIIESTYDEIKLLSLHYNENLCKHKLPYLYMAMVKGIKK